MFFRFCFKQRDWTLIRILILKPIALYIIGTLDARFARKNDAVNRGGHTAVGAFEARLIFVNIHETRSLNYVILYQVQGQK